MEFFFRKESKPWSEWKTEKRVEIMKFGIYSFIEQRLIHNFPFNIYLKILCTQYSKIAGNGDCKWGLQKCQKISEIISASLNFFEEGCLGEGVHAFKATYVF